MKVLNQLALTIGVFFLFRWVWQNFVYGEFTNDEAIDLQVHLKDTTYYFDNLQEGQFTHNFRDDDYHFIEVKTDTVMRRIRLRNKCEKDLDSMVIDYKSNKRRHIIH